MTPNTITRSVRPVPATIVTGFLGAGKTTLLNHILRQPHGRRLALIINEVSNVSIDDQLIERCDEEILLLANGCICCTVRKDLVDSIRRLLQRGGFDYLLIETTGLASPGPIAQTFLNIPALSPYVRLDGIVTMVDLEHIEKQLTEVPVCSEQIALADFIVTNKIDLVDATTQVRIDNRIRHLNPRATLLRSAHAIVPPAAIIDVEAFDVDRLDNLSRHAAHEPSDGHAHDLMQHVSLTVGGLFDAYRLQAFLQNLSTRARVYRSKGILAVAGSRRRAVFHGVCGRFTIYWDRPWRNDETRESRLVFIGRNLDDEHIRRQLQSCVLSQLRTAPLQAPVGKRAPGMSHPIPETGLIPSL